MRMCNSCELASLQVQPSDVLTDRAQHCRAWLIGSVLVVINVVTLHQAQL